MTRYTFALRQKAERRAAEYNTAMTEFNVKGDGVPELYRDGQVVVGKAAGTLYASSDEEDAQNKATWVSRQMPWRSQRTRDLLTELDKRAYDRSTATNKRKPSVEGSTPSRLTHRLGRKLERNDPVSCRWSYDANMLRTAINQQVRSSKYFSDERTSIAEVRVFDERVILVSLIESSDEPVFLVQHE